MEPSESRQPNESGDRVRAAVLLVVLALVAASIWNAFCRPPDAPSSNDASSPAATSQPALDATASVLPAPEAPAPQVKRAHRVRPPAPPARGADAESLWSYGERYLGWQPRDEVDLAQHAPEVLHTWIQQDLRIRELDDGLGYYDELGYVGSDE